MSRPSKLTEKQKQIIRQLAKHTSIKDISSLLGFSVSYIYVLVNNHNSYVYKPFRLPPEQDKRRKLMVDDIENIRWLYSKNISQKSIARIYKVSQVTVRYHLLSDEQRNQFNKERNKYGNSSTLEYRREKAKELYHRKKKLKEQG